MRIAGERPPIHLRTGDVVLIRAGVGHSLSDALETPPLPYQEALDAARRRLASLSETQAEAATRVLCAKYVFDRVGPHPLLTLLPPHVHLRAREAKSHDPLRLVVELLRREAIQDARGSELIVPRLVDSLLVYVMGAWLDAQPDTAGGWFRALREPAVAKALVLIHEQPQAPWTVQELARSVAQSRATFTRRFGDLVGEAPIAYLTRWRMCLAAKLLAESELSLEDIAMRVGYETAPAFSKAFRRTHGVAPGRFRTRARDRAA